ncbi:MAG TPA: methionyl-tRNA formyltransferase, partial [Rikenellaceae bacterium]|nr:methionyl-tRNA formyltransferase [Rikenellaceae bacterium]
MNKIKIVFLGTPEFASPSLKLLLEHPSIEVSFVVTQPDKPVGRNAVMTPPPIKVIAQQSNVTNVQPDNVNSDNVVDMVKAVDPDFIIVVAYGQILKD